MHIELTGVGKSYADVVALHPVDVTIADGEFVSILGPSGCGKSTLLRCLAGLETPERGRITFGSKVVVDATAKVMVSARARRLGMVFQDLALWPHLTVFENVAFPLRARRETSDLDAAVAQALELVQLGALAHRRPHQLSGGQQQRVAFARAVVGRPDLLLMDEPLSALDASLRVELRAELAALTRKLQITTVYVTHDQTEAMSMSDRVLVMYDGRLVQADAPETLYQRPVDTFVARFVGRFNTLPPHSTRTPVASGRVVGVRPEHVGIADGPGEADTIDIKAQVEACSYVGGRYELRCSVPDTPDWLVYATSGRTPGDVVTLHISHDDLIELAD
ncbi:ABC transporter ATP-binding protein [Phytoactinopolyspora limicola]|uniref:ABC transporter ATP-binding protein n=1 Tax=Phytoactinopolyspora limicola TaxID=2715536 RepID=UPI00140E493D|nr:ABC transporter ATP-binding protein [Phytoactinopolyspora limicola]